MAEGRKDLHTVSDSDKIIISRSTIDTKSRFSPSNEHSVDSEPNDGRGNDMGAIDAPALLTEPFSCSYKKLDRANGGHNFSPVCQITYGFSSDTHDADVSIDKKNSSLNQLTKVSSGFLRIQKSVFLMMFFFFFLPFVVTTNWFLLY